MSVLPLSMPVSALHSLKAALAASTARETSFGPEDGTLAKTFPDLKETFLESVSLLEL